jgi:primosomal protein N' (replication factor Y)
MPAYDLSSIESASTQWVEVLVDSPGRQGCYTYRVPPSLQEEQTVRPGDLLAVPFGQQVVGAIAVRVLPHCPTELEPSQIKDMEAVAGVGLLPAELWMLVERVAAYYLTPLPQVVRAVLPPGLLTRSRRRVQLQRFPSEEMGLSPPARALLDLLGKKPGDLSWSFLRRQVSGAERGLRELQQGGWVQSYWQETKSMRPRRRQAVTLRDDRTADLTPRQLEVAVTLQRQGGEMWMAELLAETKATRSVVKALASKGRVVVTERDVLRSPQLPAINRDRSLTLTAPQQAAVDAICRSMRAATSETFLLQGVTGSGKTEVYLQAIAQVLQYQRSALVLVPEIGLTPQLTDRFRARFGDRVLVYHSGLSQGERYDAWRQLLIGVPWVVIGTRSAVFAPATNLGLIVLDEEHDDSYKQDQPQPCYHARTVAEWRSQQSGCPLVLGSATPALETLIATVGNPDCHLLLPERIGAKPLPPIEVVDLRQELQRGNRSVLSDRLRQALVEIGSSGQQAILFLPRRGYSTFVQCRSCGEAMTCPHCDVSLTYHQVDRCLRCHYCGFYQSQPECCPACQSSYFKQFGSGTQRLVETLQADFPHLRILRYDRDSTRRKGAHRDLLTQFQRGDADVLVGTQMLTKGLDIPEVTLVGIVAADGLLNQSDFRAGERAFQLLTQVAGRAGRGDRPGRIILQTYLPDHPTIRAVQSYRYDQFVATTLEERRSSGYPPFQRLICLRLSSQTSAKVERFSESLHHLLATSIRGEILGPCPAQVERVAEWYRWQILLKEPVDAPWTVGELEETLARLPQLTPKDVRLSIDVDPLRLL